MVVYDGQEDRSNHLCPLEPALIASPAVVGAKISRIYALPGDMCRGEFKGYTFQTTMLESQGVGTPGASSISLKASRRNLRTILYRWLADIIVWALHTEI
jgi:hypothetical protein